MLQCWLLISFRQMAPLYEIKLLDLVLVDTMCAKNHVIFIVLN